MSVEFQGRKASASALRVGALVVMLVATAAAQGAVTPGGLLSQQSSVVAESIKQEAELCATGDAEGSIGNAIQNALKIHTELAAAMPNTEELFSPMGDCFSGLLGVWDLSFAIPSLSSIRSAVSSALVKFATKKVCTAMDQARSMVTTPINQAISGLTAGTGMGGIGDLNGLSNGLISGGLTMIDPELGWQYSKPPAQTEYTTNLNPFSGTSLDFSGGNSGGSGGGSSGVGSSGAVGQINSGNSQINGLNSQIAGMQAQVGPAQQAVSQARSRLANCQAQAYNSCGNYEMALQNAQNHLNSLNSSIRALRGQLSGAYAAPASATSASGRSGSSVLDRMSGYLN